jgi:hypothetical protein
MNAERACRINKISLLLSLFLWVIFVLFWSGSGSRDQVESGSETLVFSLYSTG